MQAQLIKIGNSKGIRFPSVLIKQYDLKEAVEITPTPNGILIQPAQKKKAREGWAEQMKAATEKEGLDVPDADWLGIQNEFDEKEWT